jgi:hypothetical protein
MPYTHLFLSLSLSSLVWSTSTSECKSVLCAAGVHDLLQVSLLYTFLIQLFESTVPSIEFFFPITLSGFYFILFFLWGLSIYKFIHFSNQPLGATNLLRSLECVQILVLPRNYVYIYIYLLCSFPVFSYTRFLVFT